MDPLYAKAHGKVGSSSSKTKKSSKKSNRSTRSRSAGQPSGRMLTSGTGEPTSESNRPRSKRSALTEASRGSESGGSGRVAAMLMNAMHVIDAGLGIACIVLGNMAQQMDVMAVAITMGAVLLLGAVCGAVGYCTKSCNRAGLMGSIAFGVVACVAYIGALVWELISWDSFVAFFDHDEEMIANLNNVVTVVLAVLAILEILRVLTTNITRTKMLKADSLTKSGSLRSTSTGSTGSSSSWNVFLSWFGLAKKKRSEDFVVFDDSASMESSLLWSKDGGQPSSDDYLEFVPEHERGLANYTSNVALPLPPEDKTDY